MLHYDEAWNWDDAAEIIANPHFTPFFPGNFGREAGWVYWLAFFGKLLGSSIFTIRFTATITGILTLAAMYRLGRELFNKQIALSILAILSVFYWHVHLSQLALRANLFVLMAALTIGWLLIAYRTNQLPHWFLGGIGMGVLAYTYFSSIFWILLTGVLLFVVYLTDKQRRNGILLALGIAFLLVLPMGFYFFNNPSLLLDRPTSVSTFSSEAILNNFNQWRLAWFKQGDINILFNLPGRPILDVLTGILGLVGLGSFIFIKEWRKKGLLVLGYAIASLIPSLLSTDAPHFLRAAGLILPVTVVLGAGLWGVTALSRKGIDTPAVFLLPLLITGYLGYQTYQDFYQKWLARPEVFVLMEQYIVQSFTFLKENTDLTTPVYFTPFQAGHPVVRYADSFLLEQPVNAFVGDQCIVLPSGKTNYVSLTMFEPNFADTLGKFAVVEPLYTDPRNPDNPQFTIFSAQADWETAVPPHPSVQFDDVFKVTLLSTLKDSYAPNDVVPITLGITPLHATEMVPSLFVHVYDMPQTAVRSLITQADSQLCASYPAHLWRTDETIIQTFTVNIPSDIPQGKYQISLGIYHFPNGARLPISQSATAASGDTVFNLHQFEINDE